MTNKLQHLFVVATILTSGPSLQASEVQVLGTHDAKFNLDGRVLGEFRDHTPLLLKGIAPGRHKLYIKSLLTGELFMQQFDTRSGEDFEFAAKFAPPHKTVNQTARRRTGLIVALSASEILGESSRGRQDRRKVIGGAAILNELIPGKKHDRDYSRKHGNTIEIKAQVDLDINLDNRGAKTFQVSEAKRYHQLAAGWHKLYLRNLKTQELRVFKIEFPTDGTRTVTIRPDFAPPRGETVNAKARRRTGVIGGLIANELFGDKGTGRSDRRKVLAGVGVINEVIGTKAGNRRSVETLDVRSLPSPLPSID